MIGQPFADRLVVEFEGRPCDEDSEGNRTDTCHQMGIERGIQMGRFPRGMHIDDGVVRDVERIGYVAQELAYLHRTFTLQGATCTNRQDKGEKDEHTYKLINTVGQSVFASQYGHTQHDDNDERCHPKPPGTLIFFPKRQRNNPMRKGQSRRT